MFWKIGFFTEFILLAAAVLLFMKASPIKNEGAASWADIYSKDPEATIQFLGKALEIEVVKNDDDPKEGTLEAGYTLLKAKGQPWPFAGITGLSEKNAQPHSIMYLTVKDYAETHLKMLELGAVAVMADKYANGTRFGIYSIPGGVDLGIMQREYASKE